MQQPANPKTLMLQGAMMSSTPGFNHYMNQPSYGQKFYNAVPEIGTRNMFGTSA